MAAFSMLLGVNLQQWPFEQPVGSHPVHGSQLFDLRHLPEGDLKAVGRRDELDQRPRGQGVGEVLLY